MRPSITLNVDVVVANVRAWAAHCDARVHAVLKADGYGWGAARLAAALEDVCERYIVSDADEFFALKPHTQKPMALIVSVPLDELERVVAAGGIVTVRAADEVRAAASVAQARGIPLRLRVGLFDTVGWSGANRDVLPGLASAFVACNAEVEAWGHLTNPEAFDQQLETWKEAVAVLRREGVNVVSTDVDSTHPAARGVRAGDAVRIGVGLFGARYGFDVPGVACAMRVDAPVNRVDRYAAGMPIGYGNGKLASDSLLASARCGYSDGFPRDAAGWRDILFVGMQYATVRTTRTSATVSLLDDETDLSAFASHCGRSVHEIVTALGAHAQTV